MDLGAKPEAKCDICRHKDEEEEASSVCKQCRYFLCQRCSSKHDNLLSFRDHVLIKLTGTKCKGTIPAASSQSANDVDNVTKNASLSEDNTIVDSDYVFSTGLSPFFNAQENSSLSLTFSSELGVDIGEEYCNVFCLPDDRLVIHSNDKITIFSKECHRQYEMGCSKRCAVVHTEDNTIAILNFYPYIDRYSLGEKESNKIDTIKFENPKDVTRISMLRKYPAFAYGDGHYVIFFRVRHQSYDCHHQLCIYSNTGKLLRQIPYEHKIIKVEYFDYAKEYDYHVYVSLFQHRSELYLVRFARRYDIHELFRLNMFGNSETLVSLKSEDRSEIPLHFDGEYILFTSQYKRSLIIEELATKNRRTFDISLPKGDQHFYAIQNNPHRILIFSKQRVDVFGLSLTERNVDVENSTK